MSISYAPLHLLILGKCYAVHKRIVTISKTCVHRKNQLTRGNNTIPYKLPTLMTFETLKWKIIHSRPTIVTSDELPLVYRAPESASEHSHFGQLRNIVISGQARIGTAQLQYLSLLLFETYANASSYFGLHTSVFTIGRKSPLAFVIPIQSSRKFDYA